MVCGRVPAKEIIRRTARKRLSTRFTPSPQKELSTPLRSRLPDLKGVFRKELKVRTAARDAINENTKAKR